jgi:hypothetical protein
VRYEVDLDLTTAMQCNCSICAKRGYLLAFAPMSRFRLLAGHDATTDYQFGAKVVHHLFCATCGVAAYGRGQPPGSDREMAAINVRCLDGVGIDALNITSFDGKSR